MKSRPSVLAALAALTAAAHAAPPAKPLFRSKVVNVNTPGHAVDIDVQLNGAPKLYLVVTDGGNDFACDWSDWAEPVISGDFGEKKLTELTWVSATADWGNVNVNRNAGGTELIVNGAPVPFGIGTHANSVIEYNLPPGTKRFKARGALDKGGAAQGHGASVTFEVYTEKPSAARKPGGGGGGLDPADALAALEVAEGLEAQTFASEPMLLSPSSIDIDNKGRVWVAEIYNYRGHNGKRAGGDRILVLEDTDGDGSADKQTVFYEGTDINSPHGVCVLGSRVIVSAGDKVFIFHDDDGNLKADPDKKEILFQGISGTQHDHGIHAFHFGPDGKLYFNFGNEGHQLKTKDGKPVTDAAGNEVAQTRKPYQQGCVFRCNLDGTGVETLGWNFRNNWEANVDSFGTVWQSDNDDDGNKGVRINYVMQYGNYGFRDEVTGAAWEKGNAKTDDELHTAHWHLNDPGVVPNLLHTGAGSPTGILIYEGALLPEKYQGQMIHCDAGPNIVRAYPVQKSGAGYTATISNILEGVNDRWFRPADVAVAPDGSLFVADWYDPGVGGHGMGDLERGRIYRVTPKGVSGYKVTAPDLATADGAAAALVNPCEETRFQGWTALSKLGAAALPAVQKLSQSGNPRHRARALWFLGKMEGQGEAAVKAATADKDEDVRTVGLRLGLQLGLDGATLVKSLVRDSSPLVRRECILSLRFSRSPEMPALWAELAAQHDGKDRWYVEALGIGAALRWDECFDAWLAKTPDIDTPAARDIVWRSRAVKTSGILAKLVKSSKTPETEKDRLMRAFDFQTGPEKDKALESLLQ